MKTASTKKALLMSVLSVLVCFTMLIGTTFAWFTDSVTSANNKIIAGNLQIDLELLDKATGKWNSIKADKTALFSEDSLWEPGYTEVKILKVENEGSLARKWKANFSSDVALSELADVLEVYVKVGQNSYPERADLSGWTKAGTVREFVEGIESTTYGTLTAKGTAGAEAYLGLAVKMREEAGNTYQNMSIGAFDITILATQLTSEKDSFDELYDEFADYDGEISNAASLQAAFDQGGTYKLLEDIDLDEPVEVGEGVNVNLDLSGNNILPADNGYAINNENGGTLIIGETAAASTFSLRRTAISGSITGVIMTGAESTTIVNGGTYNAVEGAKYVFLNSGGTLIVNSATINGGTSYALYSYDDGNKLIVNDATVTAPFGCVNSYGEGYVEINGGTFTVTGVKGKTHHCVYAGTSADIVINGGTFAHNGAGLSDSGATITSWAKANGGITINGGSFAGSGTYIKAFDKYDADCYFIINGGTFTNDPSAYVGDEYQAIPIDGEYTVIPANYQATAYNGLYTDGAQNYFVYTAEGFAGLNNIISANVKSVTLMADIDMTGKTWNSVDMHQDWKGKLTLFDGNGYTISNMNINGRAMFERYTVAGDSVIKDVTFDNATTNCNAQIASIVVAYLYTNMTFDNVDIKNSSVTGRFKVAPYVAQLYNESSASVTGTFKNCDVSDTTVTATDYDFCTAGMVAFVYEGDNDKAVFENCTVTRVDLTAPSGSYSSHAWVYVNDANTDDCFNDVDGVTVTDCTFKNS